MSPIKTLRDIGHFFSLKLVVLWSPTGKPVAPLSFADSLRERRDLVVRHPDRNPDHKRSGLKPWLSAVGVKSQIPDVFNIIRKVSRAWCYSFIEFIKMGSIDRRPFIKKLKEILVGYEIDIMVTSLAIWYNTIWFGTLRIVLSLDIRKGQGLHDSYNRGFGDYGKELLWRCHSGWRYHGLFHRLLSDERW